MDDPTRGREELLAELVRADLAQRPERRSFRVTRLSGRGGAVIRHPLIGEDPRGFTHVARQDIEELVAQGLLRRSRNRGSASRSNPVPETWDLDVTDAGFEHVHQRQSREQALSTPVALPSTDAAPTFLEWETEVRPVLDAVYAATALPQSHGFGASRASVNAVLGREADDPRTVRVLAKLVTAGYVRSLMATDTDDAPMHMDLDEKALQLVAGWPTGPGDAALSKMLAVLDQRIASSNDAAERSTLQRWRDAMGDVAQDVATGVLTNVMTGGLT